MSKVKKQSFKQGIITLMFSQIFVKIFGLIYRLYLTNKDGFGDAGNAIYSSGFQIYALLLTISSIGVPNAVAKLVSEKLSIGDEKNANRIFKISFFMFSIIGFICSAIVFNNAKFIANNILEIPETELTLQALAPSIFFVSIIATFRGYFNARQNMRPTANSQTIEQLCKTVFTIFIVELLYKFINIENRTSILAAGANLATTIATIIGFLYLLKYYLYNRKEIRMKGKFSSERIIKIIKDIFIVSLPITMSAILGTLNRNIDSITVVRGLKTFMNIEMAKQQYGILSGKVDTLITLPMSLNIALTTSLVPTISAAKANKNIEQIERKSKLSILYSILIGLPCCVGMIIFATPILKLLFPNASSGTFVLQISSISMIFILINQTINSILQGLGKQIIPTISLFIGVIVKLLINLTLIPINSNNFIFGGIAGASLGTVLCYFTSFIINFIYLHKKIGIKLNKNKFFLKTVVCTGFMGIFAYFTLIISKQILSESLATVISIGLSIIFYLILLFIFGLVKKQLISSYIKENQRNSQKKKRILENLGE